MKNFMKPVSVIFFGLFVIMSSFNIPFYNKIEVDEVVVALKSGDANKLSRYFDDRVDISLPNKSDSYSKNQASMVVRDFFDNIEVKNFEYRHSDESNGHTYCVGVLQTKNGNYRTTFFMKQKGEKIFVEEMSFQPER